MKVTIEKLGHHGDGIAADGLRVPFTLPGEIVEGEVADGKLASAKIIEPSAQRVSAPCRHFRQCGGCTLQHASDDLVADWKREIVATAMRAQGLDAAIRKTLTSKPQSRRRATLSGRRTKKGAMVGFHARASDTIIEIPDCRLLSPAILAALPAAHALTVLGTTRKAEISLTLTETLGGIDVAVTNAKPLDRDLWAALAAVVEQFKLARLTWNADPVVERTPPIIKLGAAKVVLPAGAFLQATQEGELALQGEVIEGVGSAARVVDLFSGCGTFALPLTGTAEVHAVEGEADMIDAMVKGWRNTSGLKELTSEVRDLFRRPLLSDELAKFDAAVIDPPRAGAMAQTQELAKSGIKKIVFVSCNPTTFARDARVLVDAGYEIEWVTVVDQFRWSRHVEVVALLRHCE